MPRKKSASLLALFNAREPSAITAPKLTLLMSFLTNNVNGKGGSGSTAALASAANVVQPNRLRKDEQRHRPIVNMAVPSKTPFLTPQQVDPEFKGTPTEFKDKYGHVQVMTAEQYATDQVFRLGAVHAFARET